MVMTVMTVIVLYRYQITVIFLELVISYINAKYATSLLVHFVKFWNSLYTSFLKEYKFLIFTSNQKVWDILLIITFSFTDQHKKHIKWLVPIDYF